MDKASWLLLTPLGTDGEQWKVLVLDEESRKVVENVLKEDDILHENITSKRPLSLAGEWSSC